jgi:hypothetical protein
MEIESSARNHSRPMTPQEWIDHQRGLRRARNLRHYLKHKAQILAQQSLYVTLHYQDVAWVKHLWWERNKERLNAARRKSV